MITILLGFSNKNISRWENDNSMSNIEILQLLSIEFNVSINELLSGERLSYKEFRIKADEKIIAVSKSSRFSFERKIILKNRAKSNNVTYFV